MSDFTVTLDLPHDPATLFHFLAEPRNRPLWQSSLRSVTAVDPGDPHPGMHWLDVTKVGVRPRMQLTELVPYRVLTETGTWGAIDGRLKLRFVKTRQGCRLTAEGRLAGRGVFKAAAAVSGRFAPETIRKDLLRASEVLSAREPSA